MSSKVRFTSGDLDLLPDHLDDTRHEIIDGELSVAKQPPWEHQLAGLALGIALLAWCRQTAWASSMSRRG
jgi:Uma2 family endonuclease